MAVPLSARPAYAGNGAFRQRFDYSEKAIELTDDEQLKQIFESFYQDEIRHEQELIERYNNLRREFNLEEEE